MKKKFIYVTMFLVLILLVIIVIQYKNQDKIIGGERDEYGCLGSAGYTYNENINACVREWELNENQKQAAKISVDSIGYEKGTTIIKVLVAKCFGCFVVEIEKGEDRIKVTLENWEIKKTSLTPEECENLRGRIINIVGGDNCSENEKNIGDVTGFISPNICCVSF